MKKLPSFSIVLETENLGMAEVDDLMQSLDSLKRQTLPLEKANEVIVIIGSHVTKNTQAKLKKEYPWLKLHVSKTELEYTRAKMEGARVATGDIVVYADSDVTYETTWLKNLLTVFTEHSDATVACGETRIKITSNYTMSLALTWMLNRTATISKTIKTHTFSLNNFAIKRNIVNKNTFPSLTLYRGKITFWRDHLASLGYVFYKAPGAQGHHTPPGTFKDWWYRMLIYGADFVATADFTLNPDGSVSEKRSISKRLFHLILWIGMRIKQLALRSYYIATEEKTAHTYFYLGIPLALFTILLTTVGGVIALFDRDYIFNQIQALESSHTA
jgi:glycosyltransferase involved in cell wall biosynthesis